MKPFPEFGRRQRGTQVTLMKKMWGVFLFVLFVIFPTHAFAVEFTIDETMIHAKLHPDGNVEVKETHTYQFEGDFNGITRTLIPKEKNTITDVRASEDGTELTVEQEENIYKVYRSVSDEIITIDLFTRFKMESNYSKMSLSFIGLFLIKVMNHPIKI